MPIALLIILWRSRRASKLEWLTTTLVFFLAILCAFVTARWHLTSYYLRILLLPLFALISYIAYRRIVSGESSNSLGHRLRENPVNIILIVFLGWLNISVLTRDIPTWVGGGLLLGTQCDHRKFGSKRPTLAF